jgi:Fe-S-cluster containining protein
VLKRFIKAGSSFGKMLVENLPVARRGMLFKCMLCGQLCCSLNPEISEEDLERIKRAHPSFKPYVSPEGKMILIGDNSYCPFLKNGVCMIHEYKPIVCQLYPFYPVEKKVLNSIMELPEDAEVVKHGSEEYVFLFDEECPGVGSGDPVDFKSLLRKFIEAKPYLKSPL